MSKIYKHSAIVHILGIGGTIFFSWMLDICYVSNFEKGEPALRFPLIMGCAAFAVVTLLLYLTSGLNRYEVSRQGLHVRRFLGSSFYPWSEITRIDLNSPLHYIVIRGRKGRIAYSSTDFFPQLIQLIHGIHERSNCTLPPALMGIMVR